MLRRFIDDLMYMVSRRRPLVLAAGGALLAVVVAILVLTIPRGGALRPSEAAATLMSPNTELYFSLNIRPSGGQLRKMGQFISALAENSTASRMWSDWMNEVESETRIDLESEVLPWLGPELAVGLESYFEEEKRAFLIVLGTRDSEGASRALRQWRNYLEEVEDTEWRLTRRGGNEVWIGETYYGDSYYYATTGNHIIVANHDQAIGEALGRLAGNGPSLMDSALFGAALDSLPEDRVATLFVSSRELFADLEELMDYYGSSDEAILGVIRPLIPSYVAGSIVIEGDGVVFSLRAPTPAALGVTVRGPSKRVARMVPASAAFCVFGTGPHTLWTATREKLSDNRELEERLQYAMEDLQYGAGFDLDDAVWQHFNGDFAIAGLNVFPDLAGVFEVGDEQHLAAELDNLLARVAQTQYEMRIEDARIEGVDATVIRSEDLDYEGLSPAYAFLGNGYLAFGLTRDALRAIIRTHQGRYASLADAESYSATMSEMEGSRGWVGYAYAPAVMDYLFAGFEPWERDVFERMPHFEDVFCSAGFAFSITDEAIAASCLARLCSDR